jgi:hypothetical protein
MLAIARKAGRVVAVGLLAFLLTACLKLDMNLEVSSDNTVSGTVIFAVQKQLLELAGGSVDDLVGSAPLPSDAPGVTVSDYEDDQFAGKEFSFDAVPLEQFSGDTEEELKITRDGDVFHVSGTLDLSSGLSGATGVTGFDPSAFLQGAELKIQITFPGPVSDANGEISGNTVTWVPEIGDRLELQATASAIESGGGSSVTLWLIIGGVAVVLLIVIVVVMSQRRKRAAATGTAGAEMGEAGATPADVMPPSAAPPAAAPPTEAPPAAAPPAGAGESSPGAAAPPAPPGDVAPPPPPPPSPADPE